MTDTAFVPGAFFIPLIAEPEADLAAVVFAVVLFALPAALTMIAYAMKYSGIPGGSTIGNAILRVEGRILRSLESKVENAIRPFTLMIVTPIYVLDRIVSEIESALDSIRYKLDTIKRGTIPHYFHSALTWTAQQVRHAEHYAHTLAVENTNRILHYYGLAKAHADHEFDSAIHYADRIGQDAEHYAHYHDVILKDEILHYFGEAEAKADSEFRKAMQRADVVKVAAETFAVGKIGTAVHYLEDVISHRLAPVEAEAGATKKKLQTYLDDCGDQLCEGLHDFSKDMPKLSGVMATGALLAFFIECVHSPEATARYTDELLYEPADAALHALADIVGIR